MVGASPPVWLMAAKRTITDFYGQIRTAPAAKLSAGGTLYRACRSKIAYRLPHSTPSIHSIPSHSAQQAVVFIQLLLPAAVKARQVPQVIPVAGKIASRCRVLARSE